MSGFSSADLRRIEYQLRQQADVEIREHKVEIGRLKSDISRLRLRYRIADNYIELWTKYLYEVQKENYLYMVETVKLLPGNKIGYDERLQAKENAGKHKAETNRLNEQINKIGSERGMSQGEIDSMSMLLKQLVKEERSLNYVEKHRSAQ